MIRNSATTLTLNLPILDFGTICLCVGRRSSDESFGQYGFFFKMQSAEPRNSGEYLKVSTFGVLIHRDGIRIRAGVIKRSQILVKA